MSERILLNQLAEGIAQKTYKPLNDKLKEMTKKISGNETGDLSNLQTTAKDNLVSALNEIKNLSDKTGSVSGLKTKAKGDLVSALNEVKDQFDKAVTVEASQILKDDEKKFVRGKINVYSKEEIGDFTTINFSELLEKEIKKVVWPFQKS